MSSSSWFVSSQASSLASSQASSPGPSPDLVWSVFLVLLVLTLLASLRFDWLKIWWQDQLRRITGAEEAQTHQAGSVSLPEEPRPRRRPEPPTPPPRAIHAARAPSHRTPGAGAHTMTPHAGVQRSLFHRSGRRH